MTMTFHVLKVCLLIFASLYLKTVTGQDEFGLNPSEKKYILDQHILYRVNVTPTPSNMNFLVWDKTLSKMAYEFAQSCPKAHGMTEGPDGPLGQNMYGSKGSDFDSAVAAWYSEKLFYNHDTGECALNATCGHYTTLIWAKIKKFGCAASNCPGGRMLICNYFPNSNVAGERPYKTGRPCTECDPDVGSLCYRNMCINKAECTKLGYKCACKQYCLNCGTFDGENCRCDCKDGWDGQDCSRPCANIHKSCGANPGWPDKTYCQSDNQINYTLCREFCGQCKKLDQSNVDASCCLGMTCKDGEAISSGCKCVSKEEAIKEVSWLPKIPKGKGMVKRILDKIKRTPIF